jgi:DNA (cytosine-5)-methyltransferase 1
MKFIDLFAGIGGIRIPFDELGAKCVFSSEIDKYSRATYSSNFNDIPSGDITTIDENDIPEFDILLAGFPCQPFSNAGLRKGFKDMRGTLFFDICRIVKKHKPKVILLENVKGFVGHDKGHTMMIILKSLRDIGYEVSYKVLNAKNFGVPQNRERIYIVAFLNENKEFNFPQPIDCSNIALGDILQQSVDDKYTISDRLWDGHKRRKAEHKKKGNGFGYSIFNSDSKYTSTISARYYKDGSEILIEQQGKNPRKITPKEASRLQGFPESYKIVVSDTQAYKQFGNSVAVPVIRAVAKEIYKALGLLDENRKIANM